MPTRPMGTEDTHDPYDTHGADDAQITVLSLIEKLLFQ